MSALNLDVLEAVRQLVSEKSEMPLLHHQGKTASVVPTAAEMTGQHRKCCHWLWLIPHVPLTEVHLHRATVVLATSRLLRRTMSLVSLACRA